MMKESTLRLLDQKIVELQSVAQALRNEEHKHMKVYYKHSDLMHPYTGYGWTPMRQESTEHEKRLLG